MDPASVDDSSRKEPAEELTVQKLFDESSVAVLSDPELAQYLQELTTCRAETLFNEPDRLADEKAFLQEDTENLAFANYKTFIQAANCSKDIYDDFTLIDASLSRLVDRLPAVSAECAHFVHDAQRITTVRHAHAVTLAKHQQLLEILEIPQVMDTCVRAGYWEEALELAQYVSKLQRRLSHIQIIQIVAEEVSSQKQLLLEQLLDQLHTQLSLPQCLKVVGYLHRLGVFTEAELRIKFLTARDDWLRSVISAVPKDDPYQHITKVIELNRVHLFDACTQYKDFLDTLATDLARGGTAGGMSGRLDSVLAQAMYFGLSFGRIGCDFRARLAPIFERAALTTFSGALALATNRMTAQLSPVASSSDGGGGGTASVNSIRPEGSLVASALERSSADQLAPPAALMAWYDLAVYVNGVLGAFNDLRLCLPLTLVEDVTSQLQMSLEAIAEALRALAELCEPNWNTPQKDNLRACCQLLVDTLAPFLNRCLEVLFPKSRMAVLLGLSATEQQLLEDFKISVPHVRSILEKYLPDVVVLPPPITSVVEEETAIEEDVKGDLANDQAEEFSTCELVEDKSETNDTLADVLEDSLKDE